jgi:hypothetical protein
MQDPIKGAEEPHNLLHVLDGMQLDQIRTLTELGDKQGADAIIIQALVERMKDAKAAGVGVNGTFDAMKAEFSGLYTWLGSVSGAMRDVADEERAMRNNSYGAYIGAQDAAAAEQKIPRQAALVDTSAAAKPLREATPEERDQRAKGDLTGKMVVLQKAIAADTQLHGTHSAAVIADTKALGEYTRAWESFIPAAEKAHQVAQLDAQITEARRKHDTGAAEVLTKKKASLDTAGQAMSPEGAAQRASDAADKAGASVAKGAKGAKGPDVVSQWQEQLHQQEVASGEFFKDQTAAELAFWQGKLTETKAGSKDWIDVQSKIYDAEKTLERDDYQNHLASLNERIEADRDNWSKEQADWNEKLAFIKGKFGEESSEYKNAYREMEAAQREHNARQLAEIKRSTEEKIAAARKVMEAQDPRDSPPSPGGSLTQIDESVSANRSG